MNSALCYRYWSESPTDSDVVRFHFAGRPDGARRARASAADVSVGKTGRLLQELVPMTSDYRQVNCEAVLARESEFH